ncbi:hypothetical protein [Streptomyces sp. NPDC058644]|uniref:hypothetical protein n=1 Tax=unclassified Streptomyces TaxID=2593676 RepID=UPI00365DD050
MSVLVQLMNGDSEVFEDSEQDGTRYWYEIQPSGVLRVMVRRGVTAEKVDKDFGPAAWKSATGSNPDDGTWVVARRTGARR